MRSVGHAVARPRKARYERQRATVSLPIHSSPAVYADIQPPKFYELAQSDSALRAKLQAARAQYLQRLTGLSAEAGVSCQAEDFAEIREADLGEVAGGAMYTPFYMDLPPK